MASIYVAYVCPITTSSTSATLSLVFVCLQLITPKQPPEGRRPRRMSLSHSDIQAQGEREKSAWRGVFVCRLFAVVCVVAASGYPWECFADTVSVLNVE